MIEHVIGRPSVKSRRLQVLAVLAFWSGYLFRGNKHGPPLARFFSRLTSKRLTTWQTVVVTMLYLYAARNFSTVLGIASPEPMADMYTSDYFRATWVLTALDAGFWTAMRIRRKWLRDISSLVFTVFYLVAAEQADEKVRRVRGMLTVEHLRVSWNKGTTPYLGFIQGLMRPRFMKWPPREIRIHRPSTSAYKDPVLAWLYFDGSLDELKEQNKIVLDIPGGGFVAMNPRTNDDKLLSWAAKTRVPVVSLDYKKAPEYPYPYAINECYDVYCSIVKSRGRCVGLVADEVPHIIVTGDSAGGNLATAMTLMIAANGVELGHQHGLSTSANSGGSSGKGPQMELPMPTGLILFYPALDVNIGNWMTDEQMALIQDKRDPKYRTIAEQIERRKSAQYNDLVGTPQPKRTRGKKSNHLAFIATITGGLRDSGSPVPEDGVRGITDALATGDAEEAGEAEEAEAVGEEEQGQEHPPVPPVEQESDQDEDSNSEGNTDYGEDLATPHPEFSHVLQEDWHPEPQQQHHAPPIRHPRHPPYPNAVDEQSLNGDAPHSITTDSAPLKTRLAMSSMISYFNDRVLTPEMMRAMIILYIGPHNRPDFRTDYLLSPVLAPDALLARFPKTIFMTGERDPLVDDTVIFAGRLRKAKKEEYMRDMMARRERRHMRLPPVPEQQQTVQNGEGGGGNHYAYEDEEDFYNENEFDAKDVAELILLPGISHGFLQFPTVYPTAWKLFDRCSNWMNMLFRDALAEREREKEIRDMREWVAAGAGAAATVAANGDSTDDESGGLMMKMRPKSGATSGGTITPTPASVRGGVAWGHVFGMGGGSGDDNHDKGGGSKMMLAVPGEDSGSQMKRKKSRVEHTATDLHRLRSSDDLLGRRMQGLAGGLTRMEHSEQ